MRYVGTVVRGIRTPIIKENDDLASIVVDSLIKASENEVFNFRDKDVVAITEAVVGISEGNYVTVDDIAIDIQNKFPSKNIGIVYPILSRNRFSMILKGIARSMDKITMLLSFPTDEVGNGILDEDILNLQTENGTLKEAWGCGTAAVISPIGELCYKGVKYPINNGEIGTVTQKLYDTLTGIQWGKIEDTFGWTKEI